MEGQEQNLGMVVEDSTPQAQDKFHHPPLFPCSGSEQVGEIRTILDLGLYLKGQILLEPRLSKTIRAYADRNAILPSAGVKGKQKDVFPLPLPSLSNVDAWFSYGQKASTGRQPRQSRKRKARLACSAIWLWLVVVALNHEYCGTEIEPGAAYAIPNASQAACLEQLDELVSHWSADPLRVFDPGTFDEMFSKNKVDYSGEESITALPLVAGEIEPGLPSINSAGTVEAVHVVSPDVAAWLLDPVKHLLPKDRWPEVVPKARMNATKQEWYKVASLLWERRMVKRILLEDVFRVDGKPVLNGAFAVTKKGEPSPGFLRITRLIVNLVPSNSYQRMLETDLNTLTPSSHWAGIFLDEQSSLLWSSDDQKGAYYIFLLPEQWLPFMTFAWAVPGEILGYPEWGLTYLACSVIPMGWLSAVSLFQHIHRRLGFCRYPSGAEHDQDKEWRRDRKIPITLMKRGSWVQFYLDDFDAPEQVASTEVEQLQGSIPPSQKRQRETYAHHGVEVSLTKAVHRQPLVERMGAEVDGLRGTLRVPLDKTFTAAVMLLYLLSCEVVHLRCLQGALGRLVRVFEFRRPLFGSLNNIWRFGQKRMVHRFSGPQREEALIALCLLPLAVSNLRAPVSGLVTASDASEKGGGCCKSTGLTLEGHHALQELLSEQTESLSMDASGRQQPSLAVLPQLQPLFKTIKVPQFSCGKALVVGLFDGIAGLLCAVSRLPVQVLGFASAEVDPVAKKLVRKRWPGLIELGDVLSVNLDIIRKLAKTYAPIVDIVIVGAGSPCQDLSSLLADGKGLMGERSRLFFEVPRIIQLFRECFPKVEFFVENVFSMTPENRVTFNDVLGIKPYLVDAINFTYCRRPRLYWCSWDLSTHFASIIDRGDFWEVYVKCKKPPAQFWVDQGSFWDPNQGFVPTLTRALPSANPPRSPAGIATASQKAIERWTADQHCFQVYQYEDFAMLQNEDGSRRLPSQTERELLMGFDKDYTSAAVSEKQGPRTVFVTTAQLIGNSFCVPVIAFLVSELLLALELTEDPIPPELGLALKQASSTWSSSASFHPGESDTQSSRELVWEHLRRAERGGSDVRLDVNIPFRPKAWPRAGIRASRWRWAIVHGYRWRFKAHINVLEMQAALNTLKWRARSTANVGKRFLHLIDSQVCAAILTKGRTGSRRIRQTIKKCNALCLAAGFFPAYGYVNTDDNPADIPSRWGSRLSKFSGRGSLKKIAKP